MKTVKQIIIACTVHYIDSNDEKINNTRIKSYKRDLVASDSLVDETGTLVFDTIETTTITTPSEVEGEPDIITEIQTVVPYQGVTMTEFDFYNQLGSMPIAIYAQIEGLIALRDSQGKFDI